MFRQISGAEYEQMSAGGVRHLFQIAHFRFQDTLDEEGELHHCLVERSDSGEEEKAFVADQPTMYEFLARYLAGEYEKKEYKLTRSPAHETLLDIIEVAAARARSGESDFDIKQLEEGESFDFEDGGEEDRP